MCFQRGCCCETGIEALREILCQIIQKKSNMTPPPSEFFLLWTPVRCTKVRKKCQIPDPGKFGNPIFSAVQKWARRPKNGRRDALRWSILRYVILIFEKSFDPRTLNNAPSMFFWARNPKIILRKAGEVIFHDFF